MARAILIARVVVASSRAASRHPHQPPPPAQTTQQQVKTVDLHPTQPWVAFSDESSCVRVWDWSTQQPVHDVQLGGVEEEAVLESVVERSSERAAALDGGAAVAANPSAAALAPSRLASGKVKQVRFLDVDVAYWQAAATHYATFGAAGGAPPRAAAAALRTFCAGGGATRLLAVVCENKVLLHDLASRRGYDIPRAALEGKAPTCVAFLLRGGAHSPGGGVDGDAGQQPCGGAPARVRVAAAAAAATAAAAAAAGSSSSSAVAPQQQQQQQQSRRQQQQQQQQQPSSSTPHPLATEDDRRRASLPDALMSSPVLAIGCSDGAVRLIHLATLRPVGKLVPAPMSSKGGGGGGGSSGAAVTALASHADARTGGDLLFGGDASGALHCWDPWALPLHPEREILPRQALPGAHDKAVSALLIVPGPESPAAACSPRLFSASLDGKLICRDASSLRDSLAVRFDKGCPPTSLAYSHRYFGLSGAQGVLSTCNSSRVLAVSAAHPSAKPPRVCGDVIGMVPAGKKASPKAYVVAACPLRPELAAVGTNTGLAFLSFGRVFPLPCGAAPLRSLAEAFVPPRAGVDEGGLAGALVRQHEYRLRQRRGGLKQQQQQGSGGAGGLAAVAEAAAEAAAPPPPAPPHMSFAVHLGDAVWVLHCRAEDASAAEEEATRLALATAGDLLLPLEGGAGGAVAGAAHPHNHPRKHPPADAAAASSALPTRVVDRELVADCPGHSGRALVAVSPTGRYVSACWPSTRTYAVFARAPADAAASSSTSPPPAGAWVQVDGGQAVDLAWHSARDLFAVLDEPLPVAAAAVTAAPFRLGGAGGFGASAAKRAAAEAAQRAAAEAAAAAAAAATVVRVRSLEPEEQQQGGGGSGSGAGAGAAAAVVGAREQFSHLPPARPGDVPRALHGGPLLGVAYHRRTAEGSEFAGEGPSPSAVAATAAAAAAASAGPTGASSHPATPTAAQAAAAQAQPATPVIDPAAAALLPHALQFFDWDVGVACGPEYPEPSVPVAWAQSSADCLACLAYPRCVQVLRGSPLVEPLGLVPVAGVTGAAWAARQLYLATPERVLLAFVAAPDAPPPPGALMLLDDDDDEGGGNKSSSNTRPQAALPFLALADLVGTTATSDLRAAAAGPDSALPGPCPRPPGPVSLVGPRAGRLWLVSATGQPLALPLLGHPHPGLRARLLAAQGDLCGAARLAARELDPSQHDGFASFLHLIGRTTGAHAALAALPGLSVAAEADLCLATGQLRRALACAAALAQGCSDRSHLAAARRFARRMSPEAAAAARALGGLSALDVAAAAGAPLSAALLLSAGAEAKKAAAGGGVGVVGVGAAVAGPTSADGLLAGAEALFKEEELPRWMLDAYANPREEDTTDDDDEEEEEEEKWAADDDDDDRSSRSGGSGRGSTGSESGGGDSESDEDADEQPKQAGGKQEEDKNSKKKKKKKSADALARRRAVRRAAVAVDWDAPLRAGWHFPPPAAAASSSSGSDGSSSDGDDDQGRRRPAAASAAIDLRAKVLADEAAARRDAKRRERDTAKRHRAAAAATAAAVLGGGGGATPPTTTSSSSAPPPPPPLVDPSVTTALAPLPAAIPLAMRVLEASLAAGVLDAAEGAIRLLLRHRGALAPAQRTRLAARAAELGAAGGDGAREAVEALAGGMDGGGADDEDDEEEEGEEAGDDEAAIGAAGVVSGGGYPAQAAALLAAALTGDPQRLQSALRRAGSASLAALQAHTYRLPCARRAEGRWNAQLRQSSKAVVGGGGGGGGGAGRAGRQHPRRRAGEAEAEEDEDDDDNFAYFQALPAA
jgi:hypothetical protein